MTEAEARADAETLRALLATASAENGRLCDTIREYDCDFGCGCFERHCSEGLSCLAHQLDEARVEVAKRDLTIIDLREKRRSEPPRFSTAKCSWLR